MANVGRGWKWPDCVNLGISRHSGPWALSPHIPEKSLVHGVGVNSLVSSPALLGSNG